jgi:hypothetical protein
MNDLEISCNCPEELPGVGPNRKTGETGVTAAAAVLQQLQQ